MERIDPALGRSRQGLVINVRVADENLVFKPGMPVHLDFQNFAGDKKSPALWHGANCIASCCCAMGVIKSESHCTCILTTEGELRIWRYRASKPFLKCAPLGCAQACGARKRAFPSLYPAF